ncbi:hypothetical protein OAO18_03220 [Francisellaceae bacterium]|nr:hypothetical protein [Francisellaceae bacterium]
MSVSVATIVISGCAQKPAPQPTETYETEVTHPVAYHCPTVNEVKYEGDGFLGAKTYYNDVYMRWSGSIPDMDYPKLKEFSGAEMICNDGTCQVSCLYKLINMQGTVFLWAANDYDEDFVAISQPGGIWQNSACKSSEVNKCAFYVNPN